MRLVEGEQRVARHWLPPQQQEVTIASFRLCFDLSRPRRSYVENEALKEEIRLFVSRKSVGVAAQAFPPL